MLAEARGQSKRQIEMLLARWFPEPDVPATITPSAPDRGQAELSTMSGTGSSEPPVPAARARVEPLSATTFRVELTASAALRDKLEHARNLLSHAVPSGELAALIERAIDELIAVETKRRSGAGKPRKPRETRAGSRHVPVDVQSRSCAGAGSSLRPSRCSARRSACSCIETLQAHPHKGCARAPSVVLAAAAVVGTKAGEHQHHARLAGASEFLVALAEREWMEPAREELVLPRSETWRAITLGV